MKTSELTGAALDWAVAEAEYKTNPPTKGWVLEFHTTGQQTWDYSTAWDWGGPIIEREGIEINLGSPDKWVASIGGEREIETGLTPLIAAMRCYVASKLGDEVDVPAELEG